MVSLMTAPSCIKNSHSSFNSLFAPIKLDPLFEYICAGFPRLAENRLNAAINDSVVISETSSKCTALTAKQTNKHI